MDIKQVPHIVIENAGKTIKRSYEQIMEKGGEDMYESPITMISHKIAEEIDNECLRTVTQSVGFDVDKDELLKALQYDRDQYEKGYQDAKKEIAEKIKYDIKTEYCDCIGSCEMCKENDYPYVCMIKVKLDEVLKIIDDFKGE